MEEGPRAARARRRAGTDLKFLELLQRLGLFGRHLA
jgi:hypothetical protein